MGQPAEQRPTICRRNPPSIPKPSPDQCITQCSGEMRDRKVKCKALISPDKFPTRQITVRVAAMEHCAENRGARDEKNHLLGPQAKMNVFGPHTDEHRRDRKQSDNKKNP